MDRNKPPALTSPGKVGVLVALMLVVTGLGVSYFITGTFGVSWHWLTIGGPSPTQWAFNVSAFASEMLPLIGLISILAFATSVLVSGAVRRYKTYVDSGAQYKDLLRSIKSIDDLEDEAKLDQLKQHPELREFLMGLKHRLAARDRQSTERERKHPEANRAPARIEALATEAAVLLGAITDGKDGLARELSLSIPELKQIERAVRQRLGDRTPVRDEKGDSLRRDLEAKLGSVRGAASTMRRDAEACSSGARELEAAVAAVKQSVTAAASAAPTTTDVVGLAKRVDALAEALATLGEETKRIAIASALQASGGSEDDSIRVADEVRAIATRFNAVSQQWKECAPALRRALESASGSAAATERQRTSVSKSIATAAGKASLWSERLAVLAEQVRGLEQLTGGASAGAAVENPREWGNVDIGSQPDSSAKAAQAEAREETPASTDDQFLTQSPASVFAEADREDAPFADIPGLQKEGRFFVEAANQPGAATAEHEHEHEQDQDGRFVVDGNNTEGWDFAADAEPTDGAPERAPAREPAGADSDGFLTGPRSTLKKTPRPATAVDEAERPSARTPERGSVATMETEPGVIDLYTLGAVDFDERVHAAS